MGDSVKIEQTSCVKILLVNEMKVYGTALLAIGKYYIILYYIILYYIILYYIISTIRELPLKIKQYKD